MGLPPRSCATDAYHCIMVEVRAGPAEYKCVARSRAPWRAPLGSTTRIPQANEMRLDIKDPIQACPGEGRGKPVYLARFRQALQGSRRPALDGLSRRRLR